MTEMAVAPRGAHFRARNEHRQSRVAFTLAASMGLVKLGHPQPDSYLSLLSNSGSAETMSTSMPACLFFSSGPVPGRSVPFC